MELLNTGNITLPIPEPYRTTLTDLRLGQYSKEYVLEWIDELEGQLAELIETVDIPDKADKVVLNKWLVDVYTDWWKENHG